uniref:Uncharacterized protein n=1 Tax=Ditylenchus dipsaci TaxID=166011 RepID=A0A915DWP6_9BILA
MMSSSLRRQNKCGEADQISRRGLESRSNSRQVDSGSEKGALPLRQVSQGVLEQHAQGSHLVKNCEVGWH